MDIANMRTDCVAAPGASNRRLGFLTAFAIISSAALPNLIPMSKVFFAKERALRQTELAQYCPQVPDRGLRSRAEATAPQELRAPIPLRRNPVRSRRDWETGHPHRIGEVS
jgi:hypothetical protein